jgi:hypothetical protein
LTRTATRTDNEWRGFASSTVLVAAIVHRRAIGGKEEMPARFDPTFASDLTGRGFVGFLEVEYWNLFGNWIVEIPLPGGVSQGQ